MTGMQHDSPWCQQSSGHSWSCVMSFSFSIFQICFPKQSSTSFSSHLVLFSPSIFVCFSLFSQSILSLHLSLALSVYLPPLWWVVISRVGWRCVCWPLHYLEGKSGLNWQRYTVFTSYTVQMLSQKWHPHGLTNANVLKIDAILCDMLQWNIYCLSRQHRNTSGRYSKVFHVFNPCCASRTHIWAFVIYATMLTFSHFIFYYL